MNVTRVTEKYIVTSMYCTTIELIIIIALKKYCYYYYDYYYYHCYNKFQNTIAMCTCIILLNDSESDCHSVIVSIYICHREDR